jgi:hypothetical protein
MPAQVVTGSSRSSRCSWVRCSRGGVCFWSSRSLLCNQHLLKDAVVGFEHDPRMIRQACFCIQALVRGNAGNVIFLSQHLDIEFLRRIAASKAFNNSVTVAAVAAVTAAHAVEDAWGVMSHVGPHVTLKRLNKTCCFAVSTRRTWWKD